MGDQSLVVESAKFLKQLQQEAFDKIKGSILSVENIINFEGFYYIEPFKVNMEPSYEYFITVLINSQPIEIQGQIAYDEINNSFNKNELFEKVFNAILHKIGNKLKETMSEKIKINHYATN